MDVRMDIPESDSDVLEYSRRRRALLAKFNTLPHGSRNLASFELQISQSVVSNLLNGVRVDVERLTELEAWADEKAGGVAV